MNNFKKSISRFINDPYKQIRGNRWIKRFCFTYQMIRNDIGMALIAFPILAELILSMRKKNDFITNSILFLEAIKDILLQRLAFSITLFGSTLAIITCIKMFYTRSMLNKKNKFQTFVLGLSIIIIAIGLYETYESNFVFLLVNFIVSIMQLVLNSFGLLINYLENIFGNKIYVALVFMFTVWIFLFLVSYRKKSEKRKVEKLFITLNAKFVDLIEFIIVYAILYTWIIDVNYFKYASSEFVRLYIQSYYVNIQYLSYLCLCVFVLIILLEVKTISKGKRFHKEKKSLPMLVTIIPNIPNTYSERPVTQYDIEKLKSSLYKRFSSNLFNLVILTEEEFNSSTNIVNGTLLGRKDFVLDLSMYYEFMGMHDNVNSKLHIKEYYKLKDLMIKIGKQELPEVAINIPAFNEEDSIVLVLHEAMKIIYPYPHVINILDDGSKDRTADVLLENFDFEKVDNPLDYKVRGEIETKEVKEIYIMKSNPRIRLIRKVNGKKHDALNVGLCYSPNTCTAVLNVDADTVITPHAVTCLALEFAYNKANAVTGFILPKRSKEHSFSERILTAWQTLEYAASFHIARGAFSKTDSIPIISGAFGMFRINVLEVIGGYQKTLAEDMKLTLDIQRKYGKIIYCPEALAYTIAPHNLDAMETQRMRWYKGLRESMPDFFFVTLRHPRFTYSFLIHLFIEYLSPRLIPIGIFNSILLWRINPVISLLTILSSLFHMFVACYKSLYALKLDKKYRFEEDDISYYKFSSKTIWLSLFVNILSIFWRNWAYFDYSNKDWGTLVKKS